MAYTLISSTYFTVAISGYWAFGQTVLPYLLNNLTTPTWPVSVANIAAIIQITGCYQVCPLTNCLLSRLWSDQPYWKLTCPATA